MTNARLQWGIIATGKIARELADGVNASDTGRLLAVASRDQASADAFGKAYNVPRCYAGYQKVLDDPDVQAVYIATPHPMHAEWSIKAAQAGKHILVEKPIGLNAAEAKAMIDAAEKHDVFLMEAFMYRCHPQMERLVALIREGRIGEVRLIRSSFSFGAAFNPTSRAFNNDLAGGGILDVGGYTVSAARLVAGVAHNRLFLNPIEVKGVGHLGRTGVDEYAAAVLRFEGDILAEVSCGCGLNMRDAQVLEIYGTQGRIAVQVPWCPSRFDRDPAHIRVKRHDDQAEEDIRIDYDKDLYTYEADTVARHIPQRQAPTMSWDDTIGNMETLDRWRAEVGLVFEQETPPRATFTITRAPLRRRPDAAVPRVSLPGLAKPISRFVQGADNNHSMPYTSILFDEAFASGINAFDTSFAYGHPMGACETNFGWWIRNRGIRDEVVVIEKGGNPPNGTPDGITRELLGGLERLQMDRVDLWLMHRDNPEVPVGEIIDVLNEHRDAGRCTLFGVSNWSLPRLKEAKAYCARTGKTFFAALSNQLSLSRMVANPWPDLLCLSCHDDDFLAWLRAEQMPLLPWSSQGRGFFTGRVQRGGDDDPDLVRFWRSEENFRRRERANELAQRKGVAPITIALAWVLHQPFPTLPIIGPRRHRELWSTLRALEVQLTPEEMRWLEDG